MFELHQLEQLITVAECGTLSAAAEELHLSQPALSRSMQKLEAELQVPLFTRHKNKIELNENAEMAVDYARKILWQSQDMIDHLRAFDLSRGPSVWAPVLRCRSGKFSLPFPVCILP